MYFCSQLDVGGENGPKENNLETDQEEMNLRVYRKRKYDNNQSKESTGKSMIIDSASTFYAQLEKGCSQDIGIQQRYDILRNTFSRVIEQSIQDCHIVLVGLFSKVDYCIKEFKIPNNIASLIHQARKEMFPELNRRQDITDEILKDNFLHNIKATALLVHYLCQKEEIPESLKQFFPASDRKKSWGKFSDKVLRVSVERWDDEYIWATEENQGSTIQICYGEENTTLTREGRGSWEYLNKILWEGAVLNLVRIRKHGELYHPELIILEPDYLINITTIASCFETYAESPFVNLINKIKPSPNNIHIHLGNFAGQLLDDIVHGKSIAYEDSLREFINKNMLTLISCPEFVQKYEQFKKDGEVQKQNIEKLIGIDLPASIGSYDKTNVVLEPSFFSSTLGIQGRFDFLNVSNGHVTIIEQKSGKGDFVPFSSPDYNPDTPKPREQHCVQALLYRALYQYEMNQYNALDINMMLLYSKYPNGLLSIPPMSELLLRAIKIRNLLVWSEFLYAKEGLDILATLTPDSLNKKGVSGKLWEQYTKPELQALLSPIHNASRLELLYYLRFMRFVENELLLSKIGNKMKESSGFASIWHDTLDDKKSAGNIYDNLTIEDFEEEEGAVTGIKLRFQKKQSADTSNFRIGDIVILYPYQEENIPDACAQMVSRASIVDIKEDTVTLRLRNPQTDKRVFDDKGVETRWAVEHDMFESMTSSLYSAMHSFLSAPKHRRDLLLSQRKPEIDASKNIKGEYGVFNTLVSRAKQAKDIFLIIGPPGTGKTSYGLVNLLKEELEEDESNILLLSYTNRAVDEICDKLLNIKKESPDFDFIRIGSDLTCSTEYKEYLLSKRCSNAKNGNEVSNLIRECRVFCGTTAALNANMQLFNLKHFSLAIVDESSQILEPHLIGLLSAHKNDVCAIDKFVLIGDHKQLPAVVQQPPEESVVSEPELNEINLFDCRNSLFERLLSMFHGENGYEEQYVYMLTKQGRMHRDIAEFPNHAFYADCLDIVPLEHQLRPNVQNNSANGIQKILNSHRITFVAAESPQLSPSVKNNLIEAEMIAATVYQIYNINMDTFSTERTIGVIVPYRNQISTVRNAIDRYGIDCLHNITIDTVERYQGSQRDYIIYGFTVHQPYQLNFLTNNVFEEDGQIIDRKLNVAMTRARLNLILIGNPTLLSRNVTFSHLIDFVRDKGGYVDVSKEDYCNGTFNTSE